MAITDEKSLPDSILEIVKLSLAELETRGELVLCESAPNSAAIYLTQRLASIMPNRHITSSELVGLRSLVFQAVNDKRFFDWEMPTLTGFTATQFGEIAKKLPKG